MFDLGQFLYDVDYELLLITCQGMYLVIDFLHSLLVSVYTYGARNVLLAYPTGQCLYLWSKECMLEGLTCLLWIYILPKRV